MDARQLTRRDRLIRLAKLRSDKAAVAILEADRDYRPEPDYPVYVRILIERRAA